MSNLEGAGESPETLSTYSEQETGDGFLTDSTDTDGDGVSDDQDVDDDNNGLPDNTAFRMIKIQTITEMPLMMSLKI